MKIKCRVIALKMNEKRETNETKMESARIQTLKINRIRRDTFSIGFDYKLKYTHSNELYFGHAPF
jgi:hypothetical protein